MPAVQMGFKKYVFYKKVVKSQKSTFKRKTLRIEILDLHTGL